MISNQTKQSAVKKFTAIENVLFLSTKNVKKKQFYINSNYIEHNPNDRNSNDLSRLKQTT